MKNPEITFKENWYQGISFASSTTDPAAKEKLARPVIIQAIKDAEARAKTGLAPLNNVMKKKKRKKKISAWKSDSNIVEYYSDRKVRPRQIRIVRRRLRRAKNRLVEKKLKLTIKPQSKAPRSGTIALNRGAFFSPNSFVIFGSWFDKGATKQSTNLIHELLHDWLIDRKIDGKRAYSDAQVKKLARKKPKRSRKNPGNYEHYCS